MSGKRSFDQKMENILLYIEKHLSEPLQLTIIAQTFNISVSHLSHQFKKHMGISVFHYIKQRRLELVNYYRNSGMPLTEAAMKAGFADYAVFYKAYYQQYGTSPSKYNPTQTKDNNLKDKK